MIPKRNVIAALSFSAAALVGLVQWEGYTDDAVIPVPGDVPTLGFGTTTGVKLGDKTTPPKALALALRDVSITEGALKKCFDGLTLTQQEYDAYTNLAYNAGAANVCRSSIPRKIRAEQYEAACLTIGDFVCGPAKPDEAAKPGEKCFKNDGKPRKVIRGLQNRRKDDVALCLSGLTDSSPVPQDAGSPAAGTAGVSSLKVTQ